MAALSASLLAESRAKAEQAPALADAGTINVGLIGPGSEGSMLLGKLLRIPGVRVTAICDIYPPNLKRGLDIAKGAEGYVDYRTLLDRKDLQAVVIATPLDRHAPMAIHAMEAGKHVFCEKMMAHNIEDGKRMVQTSRRTGKLLQIGYQRRYDPTYRHALDLIKAGAIGKVMQVRAVWNRNNSWRRAVKDKKYERLINWRMYWEYSQGLMAELASHQINVVSWYLGSGPVSVVGIGGIDYYKDGRETFDNVQAIFEYPGGVKLNYTSILYNQFDGCNETFMGDKGTLVLGRGLLYREPGAEKLAWGDLAHKEKVEGREAILLDASATKKVVDAQQGGGTAESISKAAPKDAYLLELEDFVRCVREGKPVTCDAAEALISTVAAVKANESMKKGIKIKLTPELYEV